MLTKACKLLRRERPEYGGIRTREKERAKSANGRFQTGFTSLKGA